VGAPAWVCRKIADIDPNARIGFDGVNFALIKLYRTRDIEKKFIAEPDYWKSRGPIYDTKGGTQLDYDPIERTPCAVSIMNADCITSGQVIDMLKEWTQDVRDVQRDELLKQSKEYEEMLQGRSEELVDHMEWHDRHSYKIGEVGSSPIKARKFVDKEVEARVNGDAEPAVNKYQAELRNLEYAWRAKGWVPREERHGSN
jgi:hypothetical protein